MAALRLIPEIDPERVRRAEQADQKLCAALYDTLRRGLPTLDPELSEVRDDLLIAAQHLGSLTRRPPLVPTPEASW